MNDIAGPDRPNDAAADGTGARPLGDDHQGSAGRNPLDPHEGRYSASDSRGYQRGQRGYVTDPGPVAAAESAARSLPPEADAGRDRPAAGRGT